MCGHPGRALCSTDCRERADRRLRKLAVEHRRLASARPSGGLRRWLALVLPPVAPAARRADRKLRRVTRDQRRLLHALLTTSPGLRSTEGEAR